MTENSPDEPHDPPHDAEFPSTLQVTSKPFEETSERALERIDRWEAGEDVPHVVNFQDPSRLQRILTPRRLELIESLMDQPADSIRELASRLDRDVRQVHDDVRLLNEYRIVHLREEGRAKRPFVPYRTVKIEVELAVPNEDGSESAASV